MSPEAGRPRARPRRTRAAAQVASRPSERKAAVLPPLEELIAAARGTTVQPAPAAANGHEPPVEAAADPSSAHLATPEELEAWDAQAVASRHGHVYQSREWSDYRAAHGSRTWHIAFDDGFRLLVIGRPDGARDAGVAYASRGPIPESDPAIGATRAAVAAELLASAGMSALTVDGEAPAASGLGEHLAAAGFAPVEEEQVARHRMDVQLGPADLPNSDEKTIFGSFGATARNAIRQAERHGLTVRRLDAGGGRLEDEYGSSELAEFDPVEPYDAGAVEAMLRTFYDMLDSATRASSFAASSEALFVDWCRRAIAAGHMFYLQAEHPEDGPIAGAAFYRHGHRLSYALAGDRAGERRKYPGAVPLLVWRGIQIGLDERRTSVDLGGVDVRGARGKPDKGDQTYGPYQFRESFGARWTELTGAHRKTMRHTPLKVGNAAARALRLLARSAR